MINVNTRQGRAAVLILLLGLGLLVALAPFASGLLAAPVLYVVFGPIHARLAKRLRPSVAAGLTVTAGILLILVPGSWLLALIVGQAQNVIANLVQNLLTKLQTLRSPLGSGRTGQAGTDGGRHGRAPSPPSEPSPHRVQLAIAFFVLYFMLVTEGAPGRIRPYIPFSTASADARAASGRPSRRLSTGLATIQG
jgi:hypothetical protein